MGMGSRVSLNLVLGAVGGALAWLCSDYFFNPPSHPEYMQAAPIQVQFGYGAVVGLCLGLALATADNVALYARFQLSRAAIRGALAGFLGGGFGFTIGNIVFSEAGGQSELGRVAGFTGFLTQILIRSIGFTIMGCILGGLYGFLEAGATKGRNGAIGGAIGGFLGGLIFNPLAFALASTVSILSPPDRLARLVGWILLGAFIGFFTALVSILLKTAWVFVVYGKNEGREIILEKPVTRIGRYELAEVPIFRDRLIAANHAEIRLQNGRYNLVDGGSVVGVSVNGQKVTGETLLKDSDLIQLGNTQVIFYERATAGPVRRQVDLAQAPAAPPLVPEGACPFCGQQRDASGNCACTVAASSAASAAAASPVSTFDPAAAYPSPGVVSGVGLRLSALSGAHAGESFPLNALQLSVGREPGNDIALVRDTTVSRRHASLSLQGAECVVTDLGSSNGTFVNGTRISTQIARPGDEIAFGTARFRFEA